jgi:hypothetical protein
MVRVIIKRPDGEVIDEYIPGKLEDGTIFNDSLNGSVAINMNGQKYVTHFSNVCLIEIPE